MQLNLALIWYQNKTKNYAETAPSSGAIWGNFSEKQHQSITKLHAVMRS